MPDLTDFQLKVTSLFLSLPASKGFLLAGGAASLAQHLPARNRPIGCGSRGRVGSGRTARDLALGTRNLWARRSLPQVGRST
jgi:hypothetical protein